LLEGKSECVAIRENLAEYTPTVQEVGGSLIVGAEADIDGKFELVERDQQWCRQHDIADTRGEMDKCLHDG
jgi:hypothetical protein